MTKDNRFLRRVARYIATTGDTVDGIRDISRTWMIFPNKRSIIFARTYLKDALKDPTVMPKMMTLAAFMEKTSERVEISALEAIFKLYASYRVVYRRAGGDQDKMLAFDSFAHIGKMVLNDFSDVDAYLIDPAQLFVNLKRFKEIKSNFLTKEQKDAVQSILGCCPEREDVEHFWRHISYEGDGKDIQKRFVRLWEIMLDLYTHFTSELTREGYGLKGQIQRAVYDKLRDGGGEACPYDSICFVGVDGSTKAIQEIFKTLRDRGKGLFFWDTVACLPNESYYHGNTALRRLRQLVHDFPMPDGFEQNPSNWQAPEIHIYGVPSKSMQARYTGAVLDKLSKMSDGRRRVLNRRADNTAVIMPDSSLLTSLMYSISPEIKPINITMGLSCRQMPFATFIRRIVSMHFNARLRGNTWTFFRDDIEAMSANYYAQLVSAKDCIALHKLLSDRQFTYTPEQLKTTAPQLAPIFEPVDDDKDIEQVGRYFNNILDTITTQLARTQAANASADTAAAGRDDDTSNTEASSYELRILQAYRDAIRTIFDLAARYNIKPSEKSYFGMLERIIGAQNINFSGTPLSGVQIMGVLETRDIDFDNVILMSANERVFPRRHLMRSIIPPNLRSGYGLPTAADIESEYGYFLFRLLNCARRVYFVYDSRVGQGGSGEMTRYLLQLCHILPQSAVKHSVLRPQLQMTHPRNIVMPKDDFVKKRLDKFRNGGGNLSPSTFKYYLACPLKFFLQTICGFSDEDEVTRYISPATYGTIVHAVMQDLFEARRGVVITSAIIDDMLNGHYIEKLIASKINEIFYHGRYSKGKDVIIEAMPGEGILITEFAGKLIREQLKKEKLKTPFVFKAAEFDFKFNWKLDTDTAFNFKGIIDRIDLIRKTTDDGATPDGDGISDLSPESFTKLRFIDYKTGADKREATKIERLFDKSPNNRRDAIFQLLTYAHAFEYLATQRPKDATVKDKDKKERTEFDKSHDYDWICRTSPSIDGIKPEIYLIRSSLSDAMSADVDNIKVGGSKAGPVLSHKQDSVIEFLDRFKELVSKIFDNDTPFAQADDNSNCKYCSFLNLCDRKVKFQ